MKNIIFLLSFIFCSLAVFSVSAMQKTEIEQQEFSGAELAQMLAPIALYPDSLLTHILIASTYPIEVVEAHRWLKKHEGKSAEELVKNAEDFDWDASVKALLAFERVLGRLSEDLSWTQQLGDAFLQDEARLLESIQALRKQAELAGNLEKMENMEVSHDEDNIVIAPIEKEIVYVPYYDTRRVYGSWHWSSYPPVYWTPHHSVYVNHYSPFYWHSGIHISFNYFFSAFHWHNRHVLVVNPHRSHYRSYQQRPRRAISSGGYAKRWSHEPKHRKGVAYRNKHVSRKYHSNRVKVHKTSKQLHSANLTQRKLKESKKVYNRHQSIKQVSAHKAVTNKRIAKNTLVKNKPAKATYKRNNSTKFKQNEVRSEKQLHRSVKSQKQIARNYNKSASKQSKAAVKSYNKSVSKQNKAPVRSNKSQTSRKQSQNTASVKSHQSKRRN